MKKLLFIIVLITMCLSSCAYNHYKAVQFKPKKKDCILLKCDNKYPYNAMRSNVNSSMRYYYNKR